MRVERKEYAPPVPKAPFLTTQNSHDEKRVKSIIESIVKSGRVESRVEGKVEVRKWRVEVREERVKRVKSIESSNQSKVNG